MPPLTVPERIENYRVHRTSGPIPYTESQGRVVVPSASLSHEIASLSWTTHQAVHDFGNPDFYGRALTVLAPTQHLPPDHDTEKQWHALGAGELPPPIQSFAHAEDAHRGCTPVPWDHMLYDLGWHETQRRGCSARYLNNDEIENAALRETAKALSSHPTASRSCGEGSGHVTKLDPSTLGHGDEIGILAEEDGGTGPAEGIKNGLESRGERAEVGAAAMDGGNEYKGVEACV